MKHKIILLIFASLLACGFIKKRPVEPVDFRVKTRQLAIQKAQELSKKYNISLGGHGLSAMYEVEKIKLYFNQFKKLNIEDGRKILVEITLELIDFFNSNEEISCHYKNYPLTVENFYIVLFSFSPSGKIYGYPNIDRAINNKGKIRYASFDPNNHDISLTDKEKRETFEEAVQILSQDSQGN